MCALGKNKLAGSRWVSLIWLGTTVQWRDGLLQSATLDAEEYCACRPREIIRHLDTAPVGALFMLWLCAASAPEDSHYSSTITVADDTAWEHGSTSPGELNIGTNPAPNLTTLSIGRDSRPHGPPEFTDWIYCSTYPHRLDLEFPSSAGGLKNTVLPRLDLYIVTLGGASSSTWRCQLQWVKLTHRLTPGAATEKIWMARWQRLPSP